MMFKLLIANHDSSSRHHCNPVPSTATAVRILNKVHRWEEGHVDQQTLKISGCQSVKGDFWTKLLVSLRDLA